MGKSRESIIILLLLLPAKTHSLPPFSSDIGLMSIHKFSFQSHPTELPYRRKVSKTGTPTFAQACSYRNRSQLSIHFLFQVLRSSRKIRINGNDGPNAIVFIHNALFAQFTPKSLPSSPRPWNLTIIISTDNLGRTAQTPEILLCRSLTSQWIT